MRKSGTTQSGARFVMLGWCIRQLAYKYKVSKDGDTTIVYIDTMRQLKDAIASFELQLAQQYYDGTFTDE